jgi:hypothetical protein
MALGFNRLGMFGSKFGHPPAYGTPPIAPTPAEMQGDPALEAGAVPTPRKKGILGTGVGLADLIGIAGDAVAINRGMAPMYAQAWQAQQEQKRKLEFAAQQREQAMQDWQAQYDYKIAHPAIDPPKPGSFAWYQTASPEERAVYDQYNPVTAATWQGPVIIPRRAPPGGALPTFTQDDWDKAAQTGGGVSNGTGGF